MRGSTRCGLAGLFLLLGVSMVKAEVKTSEVTLKSGDEEIKAFLAEPEGDGPFPGIVVIQEWWGLNDWIKENAKRLAGQGYVVLGPDLYHGKVTDDPKVAGQLSRGLSHDRALQDLKASVDKLTSMPHVNKDRIGTIGWCMGGGFALQLALHDERIKACTICYGRLVTDPNELKSLRATVLGIFGEEDKGIPPEMVHKFEEALKEAGKKVQAIRIYQAGHGFMRPTNGPDKKNPVYREEAANDAWRRIERFFATTLAGK